MRAVFAVLLIDHRLIGGGGESSDKPFTYTTAFSTAPPIADKQRSIENRLGLRAAGVIVDLPGLGGLADENHLASDRARRATLLAWTTFGISPA